MKYLRSSSLEMAEILPTSNIVVLKGWGENFCQKYYSNIGGVGRRQDELSMIKSILLVLGTVVPHRDELCHTELYNHWVRH